MTQRGENPKGKKPIRKDDAGDATNGGKGDDSGSVAGGGFNGIASAEWLTNAGDASDVVLSSRVRLPRNLAGHTFVHRASKEDPERPLQTCRHWILAANVCDRIMWVDLHESPPIERNLLVERHLISKQHAKGKAATSG